MGEIQGEENQSEPGIVMARIVPQLSFPLGYIGSMVTRSFPQRITSIQGNGVDFYPGKEGNEMEGFAAECS